MSFSAKQDRLLPQEYRQWWTDLISRQRALVESTDSSALVFRVESELFALPTVAVQEVLTMREVHSIPHRRGGILLGVANCHGQLLTCVSVRGLLGMSEQPSATSGKAASALTRQAQKSTARLVVLNWHENRLGFVVDEVLGTVRFKMASLQSAPSAVQVRVGCIVGLLDWESRMVTILDADRLLVSTTQSLA